MEMIDFIRQNRGDLARIILDRCPAAEITEDEIEDWIINQPDLYEWARSKGVDV